MGVVKRLVVEVNTDKDGDLVPELIRSVRDWCRETESAEYRVEELVSQKAIEAGDVITIMYGPVKIDRVFQLRFDTVLRGGGGNLDLRTGDGAQIGRVQQ